MKLRLDNRKFDTGCLVFFFNVQEVFPLVS